MKVVFDTMLLIHLAQLSLLNEKLSTFDEVLIPQSVYEEATKHKDKYADAQIIENELKKAKNTSIVSSNYQKESLQILGLERGECEAVSIFLEKQIDFIFSNDPIFRSLGPLLKLNVADTPTIIIDQVREKQLSKQKAKTALQQLKSLTRYSELYLDGIIKLLEDGYFD